LARDVLRFAEPSAAAFPTPEALAHERAEDRLRGVDVEPAARVLAALDLEDRALDLAERFRQPRVGVALRRVARDLAQRHERAFDRALSIERRTRVRRREVALLDERASRFAERHARAVLIALARRATQYARDAWDLVGRARERGLEPARERFVVE